MGPIWGRQDPGGPHVGPMNIANLQGSINNMTTWLVGVGQSSNDMTSVII